MKAKPCVAYATLIIGLLIMALALPVAAKVNVVTSIKPLELLVRAVATDNVAVTSLVGPGGSPHNYTLRPSQRRALEQADAIFWVGPGMESFLTRLLANNEFSGRTHQLMLEMATHGHTGHPENDDQNGDHDQHNHNSGEDPHLWVDPEHARNMARAIAEELVELDHANTQAIHENLKAFEYQLDVTEARIREQLKPLRNHKLFAYHSAFTRFAEHYGLQLQGVLTLNPALSPGAKHIAQVQSQLKQAGTACLLTEPQFNTQWWKSITQGLNITFSTWDPLATDIPATAAGYIQFQQSIADAVLECRL